MGKSISKLTEEWHLACPMPKKATIEERLAWHVEHSKHCGCRPNPEKLEAEIKKRKAHSFFIHLLP